MCNVLFNNVILFSIIFFIVTVNFLCAELRLKCILNIYIYKSIVHRDHLTNLIK